LLIIGPRGSGKTELVNAVLAEFFRDYPAEAARFNRQAFYADLTALSKEFGIIGADARMAEPFWNKVFETSSITFIDEVHQLVGIDVTTGRIEGSMTTYSLPVLEKGTHGRNNTPNGALIASTTLELYQSMMEKNGPFVDRFEVVEMDSTGIADRRRIVADLAQDKRRKDRRVYTPEAIDYFTNNFFAIAGGKNPNRGAKDAFNSVDANIGVQIKNGAIVPERDGNNYIITEEHVRGAIDLRLAAKQVAIFEDQQAKIQRALGDFCTLIGLSARDIGLGTQQNLAALGRSPDEDDHGAALFRMRRVLVLIESCVN
jgi:hypothetical protein